jgi:polysaccharide biosynthesis protein PslG
MTVRGALAVLALALPVPGAAAAAPAPWVGFNDISSVSGAVPFDTAARAAANAGADSTRMIIDWSWIEPKNDVYAWGVVDGVYWADLARGMRPLIGITGAPRWAWDAGATCPAGAICPYPPGRKHYGDYQQMIRLLALRYPRAVAIEIGNEPNLSWAWAGGLDPARYTELVKRGYAAVKSVSPAMPVIAGGLAPVLTDTTTSDSIGLRPFLEAMYANGVKGYMDGISVHPYPRGTNFSESFAALSLVKETRSAHGDSVPLWVTEFGLTTSTFSAYTQGITIPALYRAFRADPEIRSVYVHTLYDDPANPVVAERGYGMLLRDQTPKPAYCGLALANGSPWSCPDTVAAATPTSLQSSRWEAQVLLQAAADAARRVHLANGSYAGLTSAALHAVDARISSEPPAGDTPPGAAADPTRVGVYAWGSDGVLLCNTSQADRSYCILTSWRKSWTYGSATGTIYAAAGATIHHLSTRW